MWPRWPRWLAAAALWGAAAGAAHADIVITPLGSPRILVPDASTLSRLKASMSQGAPAAARFKAYVDAQMNGADYYEFAAWHAALMYQVTGKSSYCDYAVQLTDDFVRSEEALIERNQRATVAADSYLYVGPTIGNVSMVYDWCRAQMSSAQRARWVTYANQAVWNVWNPEQAQWGQTLYPWSGWSIDNPSNNYYYSFLRATMLLGLASHDENALAPQWIDKFRYEKIQNQLVPTFNRDLQGGGSREGTGYGTAMRDLFNLYYLWEKSTTDRIADLTPHTLASFDKFMHDIVPTLDRLAPTGDHARDSTAAFFDYHREYLEILSHLYPGDPMAGLSKTLLAQSSVPRMENGFEYWVDYVFDQSGMAARPLGQLYPAHWGSGTGQFSMRSAWDKQAAYANLICGPYTESHAHQDQGSFVFYQGTWLAFDENINSHSGLAQYQAPHNLVRIEKGGQEVPQKWGASCKMLALADQPLYAYGLARVTPMFAGQASVVKWEREFVFLKPSTLVVFDRVRTSGTGVRRVWTLNLPQKPVVDGDRLTMNAAGHQLDVRRLAPAGLVSQVLSWPQVDGDMNAGRRIDVVDAAGDRTDFLHVLGADAAFTAAVRSDAQGKTGAKITLAHGDVATVRFNTDTNGGTLLIHDADGGVRLKTALPKTVQVLPRLAP
ncbi:hypothetical protein AACH06_26785 [Ideonella sp. DXS29W]|uniref:Uncharacterized protein n=1 Tax=Ideonella lacteola TaxID=2984193 RepID=A0ABU9BWU7_9BURK